MNNRKTRFVMYILGLFIMALGIAVSVKSNLGVSPVSSVAYTLTCVWGIEIGIATMLFHTSLVVIQIIILRKNFKIKNLLQIAAGIIFGGFTSFCNYGLSFLPTPDNLIIRLILTVLSTVLIAFGLFLYVPADIIPLAAEGLIKTVSDVTGAAFAKMKVVFDITVVFISLVVCLIMLHSPGSVGIGTVIAALLVGTNLGVITKIFSKRRDRLIKDAKKETLKI